MATVQSGSAAPSSLASLFLACCIAGGLVLSPTTAHAQPAPPPPAADPDAEDSDAEDEDDAEVAEDDRELEEEDPDDVPPDPPPPGPGPGPGPLPPAGSPFTAGGAGLTPKSSAGPRATAKAKKKEKSEKPDKDTIYAEDWWSHARPIFEIHGYFRVRAELFHNFSLSRIDNPNDALWPRPLDDHYDNRQGTGPFGPVLCTGDESEGSGSTSDDLGEGAFPCKNKSQAGANLRFRLNPELHISDNLRVLSQIDILDNLVMGSTPEGYNTIVTDQGTVVRQRNGYQPLGAFDNTQAPPSAGVNGLKDSVRVKRAWGEYLTPAGMLRFGRMPSHWGLGMLANAGDGYDDDFQSTADRIMFVTGLKSIDLYLAGAWDFANEGAISDNLSLPQQQPYDLAQLDDVDQYIFVLVRRTNPELQKLRLRQGKVVLNGGAYVVHRRQKLANDGSGTAGSGANVPGASNFERSNSNFVRRGAHAWIPDFWVQLLYKGLRFEAELATIQGTIEDIATVDGGGGEFDIRQWGLATELEGRLVENRLKLEFDFGWASGDKDVIGLAAPPSGLQPQFGDDTFSTFRFHPNYRIDLILNRNILTRIQGSYYFKPSIAYDFVRNPNGQKFGGGAAVIWTRASQFIQTPGHSEDLGVELNTELYFQSSDGSLNDDPNEMGGFFTKLQWGVLFPLDGLGYQNQEPIKIDNGSVSDLGIAQVLRWYMGIIF